MATPGVYQSVEKAIIDYLNKGNFNIANQKCGFRLANIFNGLQPMKMAVHPCTARCLLKNEFFNRQLYGKFLGKPGFTLVSLTNLGNCMKDSFPLVGFLNQSRKLF